MNTDVHSAGSLKRQYASSHTICSALEALIPNHSRLWQRALAKPELPAVRQSV